MKLFYAIICIALIGGCEEKKPDAPKEKASPTPSPPAWPSSTPSWNNGNSTGSNDPWDFGNDNGSEEPFGSTGSSSEDCKRSDCPKGDVEITVDGRRNLEGRIGEAVRWDFEAEPEEYRSHNVVIYKIVPSPQPSQMNIRGNESDNARLDWIPAQNDPATGRITVSARDMTACETVEDEREDCEDFDKRMRDYDTEAMDNLVGSGQIRQSDQH